MIPKIASVRTVFNTMLAKGSVGWGTNTSITVSTECGLPRMPFS